MKLFFLDTNVIIDFLADRNPHAEHAAFLFNMAAQNNISLAISAISYNNIYYILKQNLSHHKTLSILEQLSEWTQTIEVNEEIIRKALHSNFRDFEDAIQYCCAATLNNLSCLVTRNTKDFKAAKLPVLTPAEAIALLTSSR